MSDYKAILGATTMLLAGVLAGGIFVSRAGAQSAAPAATPPVATRTTYQPSRFPRRAEVYYGAVWGIDALTVKTAESGELIRFTWRVLNANKAQALNDKKIDAFLFDPQARVRLVVPTLEKVGLLRQTSPAAAGKSYWMAFSNPGRQVRAGHRVTIVIGQFRAEGLVVE